MSLLPSQPLLPTTKRSSGLGRYKTASELAADRRKDRGRGFKQGILEEKLAGFGGGISSGSIRAQAVRKVRQRAQARTVVRRTIARPAPAVVKAPVRPAPPVFSSAPGVPIERIIGSPAPLEPRFSVPSRDLLTGGLPTQVVTPSPVKAKEKPVSIWADLGKSITKGVTAGVTARVQQKIAPGVAIGVAGRVLPAIGRAIGSRSVAAGSTGLALGSLFGGGGGNGACPAGWHLNKQDGVGGAAGTYCVRNRRMNFGNSRAARRSVRRLKGARKLLKDIESMMPTRTTRRRAPQHHHHPAAGA